MPVQQHHAASFTVPKQLTCLHWEFGSHSALVASNPSFPFRILSREKIRNGKPGYVFSLVVCSQCCLVTELVPASPNDIHNSEKLRNPFQSGSAIIIECGTVVHVRVLQKPAPRPQSKFRPIALQRTSN